MAAKRGRPALPAAQVKHNVTVRIRHDRLIEMRRRARRAKITPSEWLRKAVDRALEARP